MRAAIHRVDVVGEAEHVFRVAVVVLQRDLHVHAVAVSLHVDRLVVQHVLAAVQVLHKLGNAAGVPKFHPLGFACFRVRRALVGQRDEQAFVQERELP